MHRFLKVLVAALMITGIAVLPASGARKQKTYRFFSKEVSSHNFTASGKPIKNPNAVPKPGDYFISTDNDYKGDHTKHAKRASATDHILCTVKKVNVKKQQFTALCDAQLALPGGMVIADHQLLNFSDKTIVKITGGTGKFAKVKGGKITSISFDPNSDNSDLTVHLKY